ncbi:MAG: hypothetical protein LUE27_05395 [Clostridia bacterium]|nr:hypothetical protein [Clostridia bacterium]
MKKILILLAFATTLIASGCGAARHSASTDGGQTASTDNFTLSYAGVGADESILLKVGCTVSSTDEAEGAVSKYAVIGLMYKGCPATLTSPEVSPLIAVGTDLSSEQSGWLSDFFRNGGYNSFVLSVARNNMTITKGKKQYSVEAVVAVDRRHLRKALEDKGIIRRLDSVFDR